MKISVRTIAILILVFLALNLFFKELGDFYFEGELINFLVYKTAFKLLLAILALTVLRKIRFFSFNDVNQHKIISGGLILLILFLSFSYVQGNLDAAISNESHLFFFLSTLSTGLFEELFNRLLIFGLIYCYLIQSKKHNVYFEAILISSVIFGVLHLNNLFNSDYDKLSVINQAILAIGVGFLLQVILVKTKNIILVVFIHSALNYIGSFRSVLDINNHDPSSFAEMTLFATVVNLIMFSVIASILVLVGQIILKSAKTPLKVGCENFVAQ